MRIACLHTIDSNISVFDAAAPAGIALRHVVRADLLRAAEAAGGLTAEIAEATALELAALRHDADAVLLTCSTLGPSVDRMSGRDVEGNAPGVGCPVARVDAALASTAVRSARGGRLIVLAAAETTLGPTRELFEAVAQREQLPLALEMRLVAGAWAHFRSGDIAAYHHTIAAASDAAHAEGAIVVALAQASMAGAAALVQGPQPLTSPAAGLAHCLSLAASGGLDNSIRL